MTESGLATLVQGGNVRSGSAAAAEQPDRGLAQGAVVQANVGELAMEVLRVAGAITAKLKRICGHRAQAAVGSRLERGQRTVDIDALLPALRIKYQCQM